MQKFWMGFIGAVWLLSSVPAVFAQDFFVRVALVDFSQIYSTFLKNSVQAQEVRELRQEHEHTIETINKEITEHRLAATQAFNQKNTSAYNLIQRNLSEKEQYLAEYTSLMRRRIEDILESIKRTDENFIEVVLESISNTARTQGYSLVLDRSDEDTILYYAPELDITDEVTDDIRKRLN